MSIPARNPLWVWLALTLVVGIALRFYQLGDIPFGMDHDEGHNTLDAFQIVQGARPVFLERNNGREPLFMYLMAASLSLFGPTVWAVRLTGALAGSLILLAQFVFVQSLPLPRPQLTALLSTAVTALTFWPISKGHQALRAGLLPLWVTLMLWAWWNAVKLTTTRDKPSVLSASGSLFSSEREPERVLYSLAWAGLTGVFIAAAVYTHLTGRLLPIIVLVSAGWVAWRGRTWRPLVYAGLSLVVAGALCLPLALYFRDHPAMLGYRADQASVFNPEHNKGDVVAALAQNAWRLLLMFNIQGTLSWSENLSGRPVFDPIIGLAFLLGIALLARDLFGRRGRRAQSAAFLLTITFGLMLAPSWLSERAPHYGRLTGLWPVLFLLPAWGLDRTAAWLEARRPSLGWLAAGAALVIGGIWSSYDFFVRYGPEQQVHEAFRGVNVARGQAVAALVTEGPTYVSPNTWNQSVVRFFNVQHPPRSFDPRHGLVLPPSGDVRYAFEPGEYEAADEFERRWPQAERVNLRDEHGEYVLLYFRMPRETWPTLSGTEEPGSQASFGDNIQLLAHKLEPDTLRRGKPLALTLEWLALRPTDLDHNFFIHLETPDGRSVGQFDGPPLGGSYGTNVWAPGERIYQRIELVIPKDAPPGPAVLRVGWYDWRDGARLPAASDDDAAVELQQIEIRP
jgi:4-amino-4-deoxy-L-arabinose transferase-like glycosyltransferase